eukprot:GHVN01056058.1.p1 GENE.GHVN01056058.1~~GHVN01056058.1.p1  ORF type:complete len:132 (+),score=19.18 GHVN01056058.1:191-586(+)
MDRKMDSAVQAIPPHPLVHERSEHDSCLIGTSSPRLPIPHVSCGDWKHAERGAEAQLAYAEQEIKALKDQYLAEHRKREEAAMQQNQMLRKSIMALQQMLGQTMGSAVQAIPPLPVYETTDSQQSMMLKSS